jgi:hypothetical protein
VHRGRTAAHGMGTFAVPDRRGRTLPYTAMTTMDDVFAGMDASSVPGYRADLSGLDAQAKRLYAAADEVAGARSEAGVPLHPGAYGDLLWFLPRVLALLQGTILDGLAECERGIRENLADDMRLAVREYADTDLAGARSIQSIVDSGLG